MRKIILLLLSLTLLFSCATTEAPKMDEPIVETPVELAAPEDQPGGNFIGDWAGAIDFGAMKLRIVFRILVEDGKVAAYMDSPDQGAFDIPVTEIFSEENVVTLTIASAGGSYSGTIIEEGLLQGFWNQGGRNFPLELALLKEKVSYSRPQDPVEPYPYNTVDVKFENAGAGITLAGTLTYPESGTADKGVILISGSGPQNRNEEIMGHRPFLVLADHLTRAGIAVLRFDDRGVGASEGDFSLATTLDFASDVEAALFYLKNQEIVALSSIGLAGHSEGGIIAPLVAAENDEVAFVVLMAGTGFPGEEILSRQTELILRASGVSEEDTAVELEKARERYSIVKNSEDLEAAFEVLKSLFLAEGASEQEAGMYASQLANPWYKFFLTHDPRGSLEQLTVPVLAINGTLDLQVPVKENLASIEESLKAGGNTLFTIKEFPGLNHLFQTAETGLASEYNIIEETFSPIALEFITGWILDL